MNKTPIILILCFGVLLLLNFSFQKTAYASYKHGADSSGSLEEVLDYLESNDNDSLPEPVKVIGFSAGDFNMDFSRVYDSISGDTKGDYFSYRDDILNQQEIIEINEDVFVKMPYKKVDGISRVTSVKVQYDENVNAESEPVFIAAMYAALYKISYLKNINLPEDFNQFLSDIISTGKQEFGDCFVYFSRSGSEGSYHYEMLVTKDDSAMGLSKDTESSSSTAAYDQNAAKQFSDVLAELEAQKLIPETGRQSYYNENYEDSWAQIDWYQWYPFTKAKNFVITAEISWESAVERPNTFNAGCGFVFRDNGNKNSRSMLTASINMDGRVYLSGKRSGYSLNYHDYYYGKSEIQATHQFTVLANGDNVRIYVDGQQVANYVGVAVVDEGSIGFATMSGTNKGFGTRCEFKNIFYDVW